MILLDHTGVGLSSGNVPVTVTEMARDAIAFLDELEIKRIDLLGYSLGGMVAQELALLRPSVVRRIVLTGTGPRAGQQMHGWILDIERQRAQLLVELHERHVRRSSDVAQTWDGPCHLRWPRRNRVPPAGLHAAPSADELVAFARRCV